MTLNPRLALTVLVVAALSSSGCSKKAASPTAPAPPSGPYATIQTFMGVPQQAGLGNDGQGPLAVNLYLPLDLTYGPDGLFYVLDWNNHRVRRLDADGKVRTIIGTGMLGDALEGPPLASGLNHPTHVSFDLQGRLILSAWHNSKIMRVDFGANFMERIVGDGSRSYNGDGRLASETIVDLPVCSIVDATGNIYFMDQANQIVRRIDAATAAVTRVAGTAPVRTWNGQDSVWVRQPGYVGDGGLAVDAKLNQPVDQWAFPGGRLAFGPGGDLYLCDYGNNCVRRINATGVITTVAGSGVEGFSGDGGPATQAQLKHPTDVAFDSAGDMYIMDNGNSCVRKVSNGTISTFAGQGGMQGFSGDGGAPTAALLDRPYGIEFDTQDNLYIADTHNHVIRVIRK